MTKSRLNTWSTFLERAEVLDPDLRKPGMPWVSPYGMSVRQRFFGEAVPVAKDWDAYERAVDSAWKRYLFEQHYKAAGEVRVQCGRLQRDLGMGVDMLEILGLNEIRAYSG